MTDPTKDLTFSASRLTGVLKCPRRARLEETHRSRPGFAAQVGLLVHRALETLSGQLVNTKSFLAAVDERAGRASGAVLKRAREIAAAAGPMDLRKAVSAEERFRAFPIADCWANGVVDRVDVVQSEGGRRVLVVDYKTGQIPSRDELETAPQTIIYLAWALEEYFDYRPGPNDSLAMVYEWPEHSIRVQVEYDEETVRLGSASASMIWRRYKDDSDPPATPETNWCSHCDHRKGCPAFEEVTTRKHVVPDWEGKGLGELVELRHQLKRDSAMLDAVRSDLDQEIMTTLEEDGERKWSDEDYSATVTSRGSQSYSTGVLRELVGPTGLSLERLIARCCTISAPKLKKIIAAIEGEDAAERATKSVELYESKTRSKPFLLVRSKGGLF